MSLGDFRPSGPLSSETNTFGGSRKQDILPRPPHVRWHRALCWPTTSHLRRGSVTRATSILFVDEAAADIDYATDNAGINDNGYDRTWSRIHLAALPYHCLGRRKNHQRQPRWLWYEGDGTFRAALAITCTSTQPWRLQAFRPQTRKILYSIVWRKFRALRMGQRSKLHTECRVESNDWAFVMCCRHNRPVSTPSVCLLVLRSFYTTSWACINCCAFPELYYPRARGTRPSTVVQN